MFPIKGGGGGLCQNVCCNTFSYIWSRLENHRSEGAKVCIFGEVPSLGVQKFQNQSHIGAVREKLLQQKPKI